MSRTSAGVLLHRERDGSREVLLGHLGGPLWSGRARSWGIVKGELQSGEDSQDAAAREFAEELGLPVPPGEWHDLGQLQQSRKTVRVWAVEADLDPASITPGTFDMEWPPRSGRRQSFPEVDRVDWFGLARAREEIIASQEPVIDRLQELAGTGFSGLQQKS